MMASLQLLFIFAIFYVANGNDVVTRLELLEKQLEEVLKREVHTLRENEKQDKALHDMKTVVQELEATVARQQSHIVELQATVNQQADIIAALESERVHTELSEAFQDITQVKDKPEPDVTSGGKKARSGIVSRRQPPEMLVAFTAVKTATQSGIGIKQNIIFENVILNQGNGFHSQHGVFIAPQAGIYLFTASLLHEAQSFAMHAAIVHNGIMVAKFHGYNEWEQFSQTVIISVNVGEEVYVRNIAVNNEIIHGDSYSTFSGFLLWQL
ncbi:cerebellin-1-like [Mya arenaria]|uniref:cerebellin-1-like n=1 Tax=Mya arenaria TaxID=6604 RepID=UPI0022E60260|nr:cerebellin-1-like [Mya arenaria]